MVPIFVITKNLLIWYRLRRSSEHGLLLQMMFWDGGTINSLNLLKFDKVFYIWRKAKTIEDLFVYTDIFSNLLPITLFFIFFSKVKKDAGLRIITIYAIASFIINYTITLTSNTNTILYETFTLIEFTLFICFIYSQLSNKSGRTAIIAAIITFAVFLFIYTFLAKAVKGIDSVPIGVETIIILGFAFYYLYERMNDTTTLFIYNTYPFWVVLGMVLYLAGSFFIYIFASYLRNYDDIRQFWIITNVFSIIKNIFFCIAIYIHAKPSKESIKYNLELSRLN